MKWQPKILFLAESIGKELARSYIFWRYKEREREIIQPSLHNALQTYIMAKGF